MLPLLGITISDDIGRATGAYSGLPKGCMCNDAGMLRRQTLERNIHAGGPKGESNRYALSSETNRCAETQNLAALSVPIFPAEPRIAELAPLGSALSATG